MLTFLSKFKKKKKFYSASIAFLILLISFLTASVRGSLLDVLQHPLRLFSLCAQEARALVFFHSNYVQNKKLKEQVSLLRLGLTNMQEAALENKRLHQLLSLKENSPYRVTAASVIGRSAENWSSLLIIDKGKSGGVRTGMVVIGYAGLVGRIVETSQDTAKVLLISDPSFAVSAMVERSRQEGLICGTLGKSLTMKYLPTDADIKNSDIILTSGMTSDYPKGLLIGTVVQVSSDLSGLAYYAVVKPAAELSNIEEVLIIVE